MAPLSQDGKKEDQSKKEQEKLQLAKYNTNKPAEKYSVNFDSPAHSPASTELSAEKLNELSKYNIHSKNTINKKDGVGLFDTITLRYHRSAIPRLFKKIGRGP